MLDGDIKKVESKIKSQKKKYSKVLKNITRSNCELFLNTSYFIIIIYIYIYIDNQLEGCKYIYILVNTYEKTHIYFMLPV